MKEDILKKEVTALIELAEKGDEVTKHVLNRAICKMDTPEESKDTVINLGIVLGKILRLEQKVEQQRIALNAFIDNEVTK